ncbi:MAG: nitroreductase family protein [Synechococcaceae cyanobacterium SM2_3_2]|nr:nitroreductase family protein [Synechococcaceae cyanobacterium SM2_3_2]
MQKSAATTYPILPLLSERWSPRAFADRPVEKEKLQSLFEAARWSASCYNDQPWTFFVATRADPATYGMVLDWMVPFNQSWAKQAPVLIAGIARTHMRHNGDPNGWAEYDLGQSVATLSVEATHLGLHLHQMAGFDADKISTSLQLDDSYKPMVMIALGYIGDPDTLPESLQEKEKEARQRLPLEAFVFAGQWGQPASFLD